MSHHFAQQSANSYRPEPPRVIPLPIAENRAGVARFVSSQKIKAIVSSRAERALAAGQSPRLSLCR